MKYKCGSKNRALKLICKSAILWEESLIDALTPISYFGPATGSDAEAIEKAKLVISDAKAIFREITSNEKVNSAGGALSASPVERS